MSIVIYITYMKAGVEEYNGKEGDSVDKKNYLTQIAFAFFVEGQRVREPNFARMSCFARAGR